MTTQWIDREITRGLQGLLALRLDGAPAQDTINFTVDIWVAALAQRAVGWREQVDASRIQRAFAALFALARKWPTPAEFLAALPARYEPRLLPPPKMTEEERARNRAHLQKIITKMATGFRMSQEAGNGR